MPCIKPGIVPLLDPCGYGTLSCGNYYPREERLLGQNVVGLFAIGTKCGWDLWLMGQNVFGTFGLWDNSLFFGTHMHWDKRYWDKMSVGQIT